jgi:DNA-binding NtrC family response regulator
MERNGTGSGFGRLTGLRVLIVEDAWVIADTLAVALESEGARVVGPAPSGASAAALLHEEGADIALVDMSLSDGFADELVDELTRRGIPFVIITGFEALPTSCDARALAVLRKPVAQGAIVELLSAFRDGRH